MKATKRLARVTGLIFGVLVAMMLLPAAFGLAARVTVGQPAPSFRVESGEGKKLTLEMLRGKIIVLFYESREVLGKNKDIKDELKAFYRRQPPTLQNLVLRLVVIDCTPAFWATRHIWKTKLVEGSRKEGFIIYGDWTGQMQADYGLKADDSNFLIIDPQGIIRYMAQGKIRRERFGEIKSLLTQLAGLD